MKLRIYTEDNYIDVETKVEISKETLISQLDQGTTLMLETIDNNIFILNTINVVAIEIIIPPIGKIETLTK